MRTVLFCTQTAQPYGGVQSRLTRLAQWLPTRGWRVRVGLAWGRRFHDPASFQRAHPDLDVVYVDGRSGTAYGRRQAITRAIHQTRPDVVIPLTLGDVFPVVNELKRETRSPRLLFGLYELSTPILHDVRQYRGIIDQAIGVSRLATRMLQEIGNVPEERVRYVPTGVQLAPLQPKPRVDGPLRIGYVGRLDADKRVLDLPALCHHLDRRQVPYQVLVVGSGALQGELERAGAPWLSNGRMILQPAVSQRVLRAETYPQLDACVLLSEREGLPNLPMEALAHGLVPVVSDYCGRADEGLLEDDVSALVFPVGDLATAARRIERLWRNPGLRDRLVAAGRQRLAEWYGPDAMLQGWHDALTRAVAMPAALDVSPALANQAAGRLDRWLGLGLAEWLRRTSGRGYEHADASEWPFTLSTDQDVGETLRTPSARKMRSVKAMVSS